MSSRQQEKERRREERLAAEQATAKAEARKARMQLALAALVAIAVVVAAIFIFKGSGSGGGDSKAKAPGNTANAKLPPVKETDLAAAVKAAGGKLLDPPSEGRDHVTKTVTYKNSNPPASGPHNPVPAEDGIYDPGNEPAKENWVHSLEHGRVIIQYKPGTPKATIDQLEALGSEPLNGSAGYHVLVMQNNTEMPAAVAAIAWTHVLTFPKMNDQVFDAIRAFRKKYTDKGPELIP